MDVWEVPVPRELLFPKERLSGCRNLSRAPGHGLSLAFEVTVASEDSALRTARGTPYGARDCQNI